jgi:manganese/zinc/iron transport system permease protein
MSSMLIAPAAAAQQWTHRLESMVLLASGVGACAALAGAFISSLVDHLPTGPIIVVLLSTLVFVSVVIGKK